jgi:hypothetical protein
MRAITLLGVLALAGPVQAGDIEVWGMGPATSTPAEKK